MKLQRINHSQKVPLKLRIVLMSRESRNNKAVLLTYKNVLKAVQVQGGAIYCRVLIFQYALFFFFIIIIIQWVVNLNPTLIKAFGPEIRTISARFKF